MYYCFVELRVTVGRTVHGVCSLVPINPASIWVRLKMVCFGVRIMVVEFGAWLKKLPQVAVNLNIVLRNVCVRKYMMV